MKFRGSLRGLLSHYSTLGGKVESDTDLIEPNQGQQLPGHGLGQRIPRRLRHTRPTPRAMARVRSDKRTLSSFEIRF